MGHRELAAFQFARLSHEFRDRLVSVLMAI